MIYMRISFPANAGVRIAIAVVVIVGCFAAWVRHADAQSHAQIGTNSPLPVYVTNPLAAMALPEGFTPGSKWRFTTWTMPSVITWTATVNKTSGGWVNLTIVADGVTSTRWYYLAAMPGSWESM